MSMCHTGFDTGNKQRGKATATAGDARDPAQNGWLRRNLEYTFTIQRPTAAAMAELAVAIYRPAAVALTLDLVANASCTPTSSATLGPQGVFAFEPRNWERGHSTLQPCAFLQ